MTLFEMRKSQLHARFCQCPEIRIIVSTYSLNWFYFQEQEQELLPPESAFFFLGCRGPRCDCIDGNHTAREDFLACGPLLLWVLRTYLGRAVSGQRKEEEKGAPHASGVYENACEGLAAPGFWHLGCPPSSWLLSFLRLFLSFLYPQPYHSPPPK